jgi:tetratricopeptide (TPR) repeat protein
MDLLRAIHQDHRNPGDLVPVAMAHLFELCPHCRRVFESWRRELGEGVADPSLVQYDSAFERLQTDIRHVVTEATELGEAGPVKKSVGVEQSARERIVELMALPHRERLERVRREPDRFGGPALAELLLEEARGHLPGRPRDAYTVAGIARAVLQHGPPSSLAAEVYARALAHQANAIRVQGELRRADELIQVARFLFKSQGGSDLLARAELDSFEGSLRRAQRRLREAESLLSRAVMTYAIEGQSLLAAKNLLILGTVHRENGDLERAIETTGQAIELLPEADEPKLVLYGKHNIAVFCRESGLLDEARSILQENSELYRLHADPLMQLRRLWIEGHLAQSDGNPEEAESAYKAVRDGFLVQGIGYDAALAALDLALLYAEQGRTAELKRVAEEIVPVFESQDVHREAATALMLFQDAVRTEHVTLRYLVELSRYLERARHDPTLAFHIPT